MKLLDLIVPAGRDADLSCAPGVESYYSTWKTTAGKIFFFAGIEVLFRIRENWQEAANEIIKNAT